MITVALAANERYGNPLIVAAGSLAENASEPVRFVILDGGLSSQTRNFVRNAVAAKGDFLHSVDFFRINDEAFRGFRLMDGNAMTYTRLLLPALLKDDEWVLYSDADVMWKADVAKLWKERDESFSAVVVADSEKSAVREGFKVGEYFCAGIMLTNLKAWRRENVSAACCAWLKDHPDAAFWDQSALNRVLKGNVKYVDGGWNTFLESSPHGYVAPEHCYVLHYAAMDPWSFGFRRNGLCAYKFDWFRKLAGYKRTTVLGEMCAAKIRNWKERIWR
jgi:lipopolysaccharide biosynthesis glycosyltransferase